MKWFHSEKRWVRWSLRLGVLMVLCLVMVSWTRGAVLSPDEDQVGDADVDAFQWPPPDEFWANCDFVDCWLWTWPSASDPDYPDNEDYIHSTNTTSELTCIPWAGGWQCWPTYLYNWGFRDDHAHCDSHVAEDRIEPHPEWYRFRLDKDGYRPTFYYEFIDFYADECDIYDCDNDVWYAHDECHTIPPFGLLPDNPTEEHELKPDIMVDPRDLHDIEYDCMQLVEEGPVKSVTLRTATAWANVGTGEFKADIINQDQLRQEVATTDNNTNYYSFDPGSVEHHDSHGHYHIQDWTELRILDVHPDCKAAPDERYSWCDVRTGHKLGACVTSHLEFDEEIADEYGGSQDSGCALPFEISPGFKDRYGHHLDGQGIQLGATDGSVTLPQGSHLLEAEWDPEGTFREDGSFRERNNGRAMIEIDIPAFGTSETNCHRTTNCANWQELDDDQWSPIPEAERWQKNRCRDHLRCETDADCDDLYGGPCVEVAGETDKFCELPS